MKSVIYVARDRERAEGLAEGKDYSIIAGNGGQSTLELLQAASIPAGASIAVFKNSLQIEELAKEKNWDLLNPSAALAEKIENKVTQSEWLGELSKLMPPHHITLVKKIVRNPTEQDGQFIVQWAHSHTGEGTMHIQKDSELHAIQEKFPERMSRVAEFIKGPMFTVNIVVSHDGIFLGNISYQITGLLPFTDNIFSTIGNDWSLPHSILTEAQIDEIKKMAQLIGKKMQVEGWKGLFGIDVIYDESRDKIFLIEINARQPASTSYESRLQSAVRERGVSGITMFEAHLMALTGEPITSPIIEINDGAQIIQRITKKITDIDTKKIEAAGYRVIRYNNTKLNSDLVRIQSVKGIMEAHNKFNSRGKEIKEACDSM